ncbi:hypothetical protein [Candidatus Methanoprimaticola sp. MG2]|uniref:hypothetical protein n=1 Tax=Candidatus Methanoprimaticola sp. MG2 TaxID=3228838 RepID=UPI0039C6446F
MTERRLYLRFYVVGSTYEDPIDIPIDEYERETARGIKDLLDIMGYTMEFYKLNTYILGDYETSYRIYHIKKKVSKK